MLPVAARRPCRGRMLVGLTLGLAVMLAWKLRLLASRVSPPWSYTQAVRYTSRRKLSISIAESAIMNCTAW